MNTLFIRSLRIRWSEELRKTYVGRIPSLKNLTELSFPGPLTFFVGENGSGKSTLLEAIAVAYGFNPEGGTLNYHFSTYDDHSSLSGVLTLDRGFRKPAWGYFLRAESFYNVASAALTEYNYDGRMPDYHARSHGESFLEFIRRFDQPGLFLMDEPEAALSVQRQLSLLIHLVRKAEEGSQFIIVTHSPILLGVPGAEIFSFDEGEPERIRYEETESYQITKAFVNNREGFLNQLLGEVEE